MSSPSPEILGSIDSTLGAVFIGFALACCVYGILVSQTFSYFRNYPGDRTLFKLTRRSSALLSLILIRILETADQAFIGHLVYYYSISNYAKPVVLLRATMTWSLIVRICSLFFNPYILTIYILAIVGAIVKCYFGLRVWRFSEHNFFITGLILLLAIGQLVHKLQTLGTISLGCGVLTDVITAGALCFFLQRLRTGYSPSDSLVTSLCSYAINTGVLTSTVSMATLILYNVMPPSNLYFVATYFVLSKLYAISFLATLNTRRIIRNGRGTDRQGATTNNTNMFHLGTRLPSMGPAELGQWDKVDHPDMPISEVPFNSYYPGAK
ncbi:uncharacterized protein LACBIDRAFT_332417 [Laccaria bicolor S238N-H82]|uniref:Predicted protein n=1 Tax=Laccaria bicolor (strain S238N-H82 / ATCC MYA-4686) TaxID=486041 RepID=B0DSN7_LACBS|nr:uncharacterized protein LACBIDRAFT_332417 [Laccaria bicolor S238N-H82]EDR02355.1 predicted protein [Laccaria bicolor S238N-H82]|eukprot:XP_001887032.1 predicted protein [Laccaria bicolor S238N-H82]